MIVVQDFGSQYTQLIAKKLRGLGYGCEVVSGRLRKKELENQFGATLKGIILSGSPMSVGDGLEPDLALMDGSVPVLAICFGYQWLALRSGGKVEAQTHREYGPAVVDRSVVSDHDELLKNFPQSSRVWMSHGDSVTQLPMDAQVLLTSNGNPAAFRMKGKPLWGLQFHPEVWHSPEGGILLENFVGRVCQQSQDWNLHSALEKTRQDLRKQLAGVDEVICAVSGGVDSTVVAVLLAEFVKVRAVYVDHGFQRAYDLPDLQKIFEGRKNLSLDVIDARQKFWASLSDVSDPETKRQTIGRLFIETFRERADSVARLTNGMRWLGQGTIYSDVIESAANELAPAEKIKSHHNVGGLPLDHGFELVEPLRSFFKDEVRSLGRMLGIEEEFLMRHPFPGPGLSIRCVGALSPERIEILKKCDDIFHQELMHRNLYQQTWQAGCILLPIKSVGVMGDGRSFESVVVIRAVSSVDAMTVEATEFQMRELKEIGSRIVNEVRGINRVVYDLTSKPPATIEWE